MCAAALRPGIFAFIIPDLHLSLLKQKRLTTFFVSVQTAARETHLSVHLLIVGLCILPFKI